MKIRTAIASMAVSAVGFVSVLVYEDYSSNAIIPVPGDKLTIGFGTTEGVKIGDTVTPSKAVKRALNDISKYEDAIKKCVKVPLYQYEYDAYLSLAYNIGTGAFCGSTLVKKLNALDYAGACEQIKVWDKFKGKTLRGLTIRRDGEYQRCIGNA